MKLSELKQIENHLKDFTIDDFYINSKMIRSEIQKLIALESDRTLKAFLHDSAKEMVEKLNSVKGGNNPLKDKIDSSLRNKKRLESEITVQKQCLDELDKQLDKQLESIPLIEDSLKKEIKDIEEELLQIQPLSGKEPYSSRVKELEVKKSEKANKIVKFPGEINNKKQKKQKLIGEIELKESEIQNCENEIKELEQCESIESEIFPKFDVLVFLCNMLLDEQIKLSSRCHGFNY